MTTKIRIVKKAPGKYIVYKGKDKVAAVQFTKKHYPLRNIPVGFEMVIKTRGGNLEKRIVRNLTEGKVRIARSSKRW